MVSEYKLRYYIRFFTPTQMLTSSYLAVNVIMPDHALSGIFCLTIYFIRTECIIRKIITNVIYEAIGQLRESTNSFINSSDGAL